MASRDQQGESITPTTSQLAVPVDVTADAPFREAIAVVDSQLVNAHWRWLHARWGEDAKGLDKATVEIDALLEQRFALVRARRNTAADAAP
jgi:hypothetical protein